MSSVVVDIFSGGDGVGGRWLMGRQQVTDLWVSKAGGLAMGQLSSSFFFLFFFLWFMGCGVL